MAAPAAAGPWWFHHKDQVTWSAARLMLPSCLCRAGERGDGGEAGGPVPPHRFQHGDAGLQEDPGESLSDGLEPQHVQHVVASADTHSHAQTDGGPACVQTQIHSICSSAVFASRLPFKHAYQHALADARPTAGSI